MKARHICKKGEPSDGTGTEMDRHHLHHSGRHLHGFGRVPGRFYRRAAAAMFAGFGLVFLLLGIGMLWARTRARARRAKLLEEGQRIDAGIIAVDWDTRFRVNGRCPLVIRCQAVNPADGWRICVSKRSVLVRPLPLPGRAIHSAGVCRWR